jgi:hypothetical protein
VYSSNYFVLRESFSASIPPRRQHPTVTDCRVGYWIEYFPNGKAKVIGHYKENKSSNWDSTDKWCSLKDGTWTYFNKKGKKLYSEYWKNGEIIKQVPEQKINEVYGVELLLEGKKFNNSVITKEQIKEIVITPKLKNTSPLEINITIKFQLSAVGHSSIEKIFTLDNFKTIDINEMISDFGITPGENVWYTLMIYNNGENIRNFRLNIK